MAKNIKPSVSVVMSVYNGEEFLNAAVDSILSQTLTDFELIVVNDGSNDKTASILKSYKDPRVIVLNQQNKGLVTSLNRGIKEARGKYIARHDADDISKHSRLYKQVRFLKNNPKVALVGSSIEVMNNRGNIIYKHHVLLEDPELRHELFIRSPFAHGSVMYKKEVAVNAGLYDVSYWPAEDYDLWLRLSRYGRLANINEPLYIYREHSASISAVNQSEQSEKSMLIRELAWRERNRLIAKESFNFSVYKHLEDGQQRIQRILSNVHLVNKTAVSHKNILFALKNSSLVLGKPLTYKKLVGNIKRKIVSN